MIFRSAHRPNLPRLPILTRSFCTITRENGPQKGENGKDTVGHSVAGKSVGSWSDFSVNGGEVAVGEHEEKAAAVASGLPCLTNELLLFGIVGCNQMAAFVFDDKESVIGEFGHKIRIELVAGGLEPKGMLGGCQISDPSLDLREALDMGGTVGLFAVHGGRQFVVVFVKDDFAMIDIRGGVLIEREGEAGVGVGLDRRIEVRQEHLVVNLLGGSSAEGAYFVGDGVAEAKALGDELVEREAALSLEVVENTVEVAGHLGLGDVGVIEGTVEPGDQFRRGGRAVGVKEGELAV